MIDHTAINDQNSQNIATAKLPVHLALTSIEPGFLARFSLTTDVTDGAGLQVLQQALAAALARVGDKARAAGNAPGRLLVVLTLRSLTDSFIYDSAQKFDVTNAAGLALLQTEIGVALAEVGQAAARASR